MIRRSSYLSTRWKSRFPTFECLFFLSPSLPKTENRLMTKMTWIYANALILTFLAANSLAAPAPPPTDQSEYAHPHQLIDVGGGRRMNLYCIGSGSPTVIFDSPSGSAGWDWLFVHPKVAKQTRACVYDRAGFGFSDPSPRPGTSENAMEDLHALLSVASIAPPFILVGNSYGGMNVQLYTYLYPKDVSGLVIVEGRNENETLRLDVVSQGKISKIDSMFEDASKQCTAAAEKGFVPGSNIFGECIGSTPKTFGRTLSAAYLAQASSVAYWKSSTSELANLSSASSDQLRSVRRTFGDLPLICLTRAVSPYMIPGKTQSALNKAIEAENLTMQAEVARLSTRGRNRVVRGAGHLIQADKPEAVVDAVFEVLEMARP